MFLATKKHNFFFNLLQACFVVHMHWHSSIKVARKRTLYICKGCTVYLVRTPASGSMMESEEQLKIFLLLSVLRKATKCSVVFGVMQ